MRFAALVLVALLIGLLLGGLASSREHRPSDGRERRGVASRAVRPVARILSAVIEPVFYWLGLLDPQGHPDNSKVMYTLVVFAATAVVIHLGIEITVVTWTYVGLVCAVILGAAGPRVLLKGLRVWKPGAFKDGDAASLTSASSPTAPATGAGTGA